MNPDYAIFVFPRPWTWLSLALSLCVLAVNVWLLWQQRRTRRRIAHIAEPLVDICRRHGFDAEAEQIQADIDRLRSELPGGLRRRPGRREAVTTDGSGS